MFAACGGGVALVVLMFLLCGTGRSAGDFIEQREKGTRKRCLIERESQTGNAGTVNAMKHADDSTNGLIVGINNERSTTRD
jgi:hypothetical protein